MRYCIVIGMSPHFPTPNPNPLPLCLPSVYLIPYNTLDSQLLFHGTETDTRQEANQNRKWTEGLGMRLDKRSVE